MRLRVTVMLKEAVLDPQGEAIRLALAGMGFDGVEKVRQGKIIEIDLDESDPAAAEARAREMCQRLLANPVIESYRIEAA